MNPKDKVNLYRRLLRRAQAHLAAKQAALNPTGDEVEQLMQQLEAGEIEPDEFESRLEELESRSRSSRTKGCSRGASRRGRGADEVDDYLEDRWDYYGEKGWQGKVPKKTFLQRNKPHVRRNIRDNPEYLEEMQQRTRAKLTNAATRTAYASEDELLAAIQQSEDRFRWLVKQDDYAAADEEKARLDDLLAQYGDDEYLDDRYANTRTAGDNLLKYRVRYRDLGGDPDNDEQYHTVDAYDEEHAEELFYTMDDPLAEDYELIGIEKVPLRPSRRRRSPRELSYATVQREFGRDAAAGRPIGRRQRRCPGCGEQESAEEIKQHGGVCRWCAENRAPVQRDEPELPEGYVEGDRPRYLAGTNKTAWAPDNFQRDDFQEFLDGYLETALWSSHDNADEYGGEPMDANYTVDDIAPECLEIMRADCQKFFDQNYATVEAAEFSYGPDFSRWGHVGHDFWLTRNGHGAGFWDGDYSGDAGEILTEASKQFGEVDLYVGDDGQIWC